MLVLHIARTVSLFIRQVLSGISVIQTHLLAQAFTAVSVF